MGQKIHPRGLRIGITSTWDSIWCSTREYQKLLHEDIRLRNYVKEQLYHAGVSKVLIERTSNKVMVNVFSSRPGIIIGKKGSGIDSLRAELAKLSTKQLLINIKEIRKAEIDAQLVSENIALQLERRVAFRRVMKKAMSSALKLGAKGIKVQCKGRLGGAEIARTERYHEGRIPLHTLRADIDYGYAIAKTTYGTIGVKVWIFKGEIMDLRKERERARVAASAA